MPIVPLVSRPPISVASTEYESDSEFKQSIYANHVAIALGLTLIVVLATYAWKPKTSSAVQPDLGRYVGAALAIAIFMFVLLNLGSGSAKLAAAFSWLIFVSVALINGDTFIQGFNQNILGKPLPVPPTRGK